MVQQHIFISYAHKDKSRANQFVNALENAGLCVWIDNIGLIPGTQDWELAIEEAIGSASCVCVLLSPNAINSEYVAKELQLARERKRPIFPGLLAGKPEVTIPPEIDKIQWTDMRHNFVEGTDKIIAGIYQYFGLCAAPPKRWSRGKSALAVLGVVLLGTLLFFGGTLATSPAVNWPFVSLIGFRYSSDGFDPHWIDLRKMATDGLSYNAEERLQFKDVWIWSPETAPGYTVAAEVYAGSTLIGTSEAKSVERGSILLGDIVPGKPFLDPTATASWLLQKWDKLTVMLVLKDVPKGLTISRQAADIKLQYGRRSWFQDTPNIKLVSVVYSVNNGPMVVLDLSTLRPNSGIYFPPGSKFTIHEVWYTADTEGDKRFHIEAYFGKGDYDPDTYKGTSYQAAVSGIQKAPDVQVLNWDIVPKDRQYLMLSAVRDDDAITDRFRIPISPNGHTGLVELDKVVVWPTKNATYIDFEFPDQLKEWQGGSNTTTTQSTDYAFSGHFALAVQSTTSSDAGGKLIWNHNFKGQYILANLYFPSQDGVSVTYAQICAWACENIAVQIGEWNPVVMDLNKLNYQGTPISAIQIGQLVFNIGLQGVTSDKPYKFYVDGVQVFPSK